jgi:hypothetical protein
MANGLLASQRPADRQSSQAHNVQVTGLGLAAFSARGGPVRHPPFRNLQHGTLKGGDQERRLLY